MEESGSGMEGANEWLTPGEEYSEMGTFLLEGECRRDVIRGQRWCFWGGGGFLT